ncbi:MAG: gliding motility-associated C-terminal domain-containing protein [Bacteroidetes bacterium]|nr:gliding motility-associated C-terminal domain-containing protein [Bacteroidota bacterium]
MRSFYTTEQTAMVALKTICLLLCLSFFFPYLVSGQINDCSGAEVICSDGAIGFTPNGPGANDFAGTNDAGCLIGNEHQSAWYYFEFLNDMPANSIIEFTIDPNGGSGEDYDFAIYGPDVTCESLGSPIRCSFAAASCAFCPQTGLGNGTTDVSEGASGNGYVAPLEVNPGEGFYLVVDNWLGSSNGFELVWGGAAAPFLNCEANPVCDLIVEAGEDIITCETTVELFGEYSGAVGEVNYSWTNGDGSTTFLDDPWSLETTASFPLGFSETVVFVLTVTDDICTTVDEISVQVSSIIPPEINGELTFCEGNFTLLDIDASYEDYQWSTGDNSNVVAILEPGEISVTVTNDIGCTSEASVLVEALPSPEPTIEGDLSLCLGGTGYLDAGTGFTSYEWLDGSQDQIVEISGPGVYSVTVVDNSGCEASADYEVYEEPGAEPNISGNIFLCQGDSSVLTTEGNFASYYWSDNGATSTINVVNAPGVYEVMVTDFDGCIGFAEIEVYSVPDPAPNISGTLSICFGDTSTLSVDSNYDDYLWSDLSTSQDIYVATPGVYSVSVTNADGCFGETSVEVIQLSSPAPAIEGDTIICEGDQTVLNAGPGFSSYSWSTNSNEQSVEVIGGGVYFLTVTDEHGCEGQDSFIVNINTIPEPEITGILHFCPGLSTTLSVNQPFASYNWSNNSIEQSAEIILEGNYSVSVTDVNGCIGMVSVDVVELDSLTPEISGDVGFCVGDSTLLFTEANYESYQWSNGESSETIMASQSGEISLTAVDVNGCSGTTTLEIVEYILPQPQISGQNYFCEGDSIELEVVQSFSEYHWSNFSNTYLTTISEAGFVEVTVTDENGCSGMASTNVEEIPSPEPIVSGERSFCPGTSTILQADNWPNYLWSTGSDSVSVEITNPGLHTLTVTNDFGCGGIISIDIIEYETNLPLVEGNLFFCPHDSTLLTASQNFSEYLWSDGTVSPEVSISDSGNYSVSVTDINGCLTSTQVIVDEHDVVIPSIIGPTNFCAGDSLSLSVNGIFDAYHWSNNSTNDTIKINYGGTFSVTVVDSNNCKTSSEITILENPLPALEIEGSTGICTGGTTTLMANQDYETYLWSNGEEDSNITINSPGIYGLTVTDENNCMNASEVEVTEDVELFPVINGDLSFCFKDSTKLEAEAGYATYLWSNNSDSQYLYVNEPGTYSLTVTDFGGCVGYSEVEVIENTLPELHIFGETSFCKGNSTILYAEEGSLIYNWSDGETSQQIVIGTPGIYSVEIADENGCTAIDSVNVIELPLPEISISGQNFVCEGSNIQLIVEEEGNYEYLWSTGEDGPVISIESAGLFEVTVTNVLGCQSNDSKMIEIIQLPEALPGDDKILNCYQPEVSLGGDYSTTENTLLPIWEGPGITDNSANMFHPQIDIGGIYTLKVVDTLHNCHSELSSVEVTNAIYTPEILLRKSGVIDCNNSTVLIDAYDSENNNGIVYQWFDYNYDQIVDANDQFFEASQAQWYYFSVKDTITGCFNSDSIYIDENKIFPIANAGEPKHLNCRIEKVNLNGAASSVGDSIQYFWDAQEGNILSGQNSLIPLIDLPGIYTLTVLNTQNGCESFDVVEVTQDIERPFVFAGEDQELDCHIEVVTLDGSASSSGNVFTLQWQLENEPEFLESKAVIYVNQAGVYSLLVTNEINGCTNFDRVIVGINEVFPTDIFVDTKKPTCFGDDNGEIIIEEIIGGLPPYLLSIDDNPFLSTGIFSNLIAGKYNLTVQDAHGCEYTKSVYLEDGNDLKLDLGEDEFIELGESVMLEAEDNLPLGEWFEIKWTATDSVSCPDCREIEVSPFISSVYAASLTDENGCMVSDEINVFVNHPQDIYIPNAFSPNDDGINDVFMVFAGQDVKKIRAFIVFNRWGEKVFEYYFIPPNDPAYGWDGRHKSQVCNPAVFTYMADVEFIDGQKKIFAGDVTLLK